MAKLVETSWRYRRAAVYIALLWSFAVITHLAVNGADTALTRAIVDTLGWVIMFVLGVYVGGASWDDLNKMRYGRLPDPPAATPGAPAAAPPFGPEATTGPSPQDERG
mgnify:CR=1 FL=1